MSKPYDIISQKILTAFDKFANPAALALGQSVLPRVLTSGKIYEAFVLSWLCKMLVKEERLDLKLINSSRDKKVLLLKASPGKVGSDHVKIEVRRNKNDHKLLGVIYMNVEFCGISAASAKNAGKLSTYKELRQYLHEIDIAIIDPDFENGYPKAFDNGYPEAKDILLSVECKNTVFERRMFREILGMRREFGYLSNKSDSTIFACWPRITTKFSPSIPMLMVCTDERVKDFSDPGKFYDIDLYHLPLDASHIE